MNSSSFEFHFRVNFIAIAKKKCYNTPRIVLGLMFIYCAKYDLGDAKMDNISVAISYNKLWKLLIDRKLKKKDLQSMTHLSSSVIAKMGRDESVHLDTVVKICIALQCDISDIVEIKWKEV